MRISIKYFTWRRKTPVCGVKMNKQADKKRNMSVLMRLVEYYEGRV